ncbi:MAG: diacylglycerol kinase family protein [Actinomycetaceae bacterium]|nr:diacylglycerol kinase family protein [Actinomycetaceae bacterium]
MTTSIIALVIAVLALVIASMTLTLTLKVHGRLTMRPILSQGSSSFPPPDGQYVDTPPHRVPWVIYNPIKIADKTAYKDFDDFCSQVSKAALNAGYETPRFIATTEEETGSSQCKQALENNASLIVCAGGDGTVRKVAGQICHHKVPMSIIPLGTGNLLARNLGLPVDYPEQTLELCFTGTFRSIDLGLLRIDGSDMEEPFMVMSGLGFDGDLMAQTSSNLKDSIGHFAYFLAGIRSLHRPSMVAALRVGDAEREKNLRARTLLFANCGELTGGLPLLPNADPADGWLDVTRIDVKAGLLGWTEVALNVIYRSTGLRSRLPMLSSTLTVTRARTAEVTVDRPRRVQIDGDPVGEAQHLSVRIIPSAVTFRC